MLDMSVTPQTAPAETPRTVDNYWNWAALMVALVGVAGSLWLSIRMELLACPLCFYQRSFMMAVAAVMAVGLLAKVRTAGLLSILSLPLALAGLLVACFHVNLERTGVLECPAGVLDWGTAPSQSLSVYLILAVVLCVDLLSSRALWVSLVPAAGAVVLGVLMAIGCLKSNPPLPDPPKSAYPTDLKIKTCRPPFVAPSP
jgi:disulfide bond formation protein DsbB